MRTSYKSKGEYVVYIYIICITAKLSKNLSCIRIILEAMTVIHPGLKTVLLFRAKWKPAFLTAIL